MISELVIINKRMRKLILMKFQPVLGCQFLCMILKKLKKLFNPTFILILNALKTGAEIVKNNHATIALQSSTTERVQHNQKRVHLTNSFSKSTTILSPEHKQQESVRKHKQKESVSAKNPN